MTISDALPVQFWLSGCETYNEYEAEGVHHVCWCQPWNCTDEIVIQAQEDPGMDLFLLVLDSTETAIYSQQISEVQSGVYQISFIPNDQDICDELIQLKIVSSSAGILIAPSLWSDGSDVAGGAFDTLNATQLIKAAISTTGQVGAYQPAVIPPGITVVIPVTVTVSGTFTGFVTVTLGLYTDVPNAVVTQGSIDLTAGTHNLTFTLDNNTLVTSDRLYILMTEFVSSGTADVTITIPVGQVLYASDAATLAKSDCLDIQTAHDETTFFEYSNQRNFDGLIYANDSPDTTFGIRIPCRFFHEVEPEEDDAMELTSSVITTAAQVKTQRLLEIKHVPYYFHKKLRRVLKHQTLTAISKSWKKEEKYEVNEGNSRWPLKSATCLLTDKNSVVRNVL